MADKEVKANEGEVEARFNVQRIYIKDSSFEAPNAPESFKKQFNPNLDLNMSLKNALVDKDTSIYEIVLKMTVNVRQDDKVMFIAEVQQAGLFEIVGDYDDDRLRSILNITCPTILFPYARTAIDSLAIAGSFPALMLAPISFDSVYDQAEAQRKTQAAETQ